MRLGLVVLGGALGTLDPGAWAWSTLTVNLVGSLALGLVVGAAARTRTRLLLGTGLIGGFTTYSAFAVQVDQHLRGGEPITAIGYAVATVVGGGLLAAAGLHLAERSR